jgi:simple sugar transport system ATP-binding protein
MSAEPANRTTASTEFALQVRGVTKRFGALVVLRGIDLELRQGEVLGLVGDNGAGKSTLVKILSGFQQQDSGELTVGGKPVSFHSVGAARSHGIETVYQDLALAPDLESSANLFLGREAVRGGLLGRLGFIDEARASALSRQASNA